MSDSNQKAEGSQVWSIPGRKDQKIRPRRPTNSSHHVHLNIALGHIQVGQKFGNRFEILECIGRGGMSVVYRARDHHRGHDVALKFLSPTLLQDRVTIEKFKEEAKIASRLAHPGIVKVFDVYQDQDIHFLAMELLEGETLRDWLIRTSQKGDNPGLGEVNRVLQSVCDALIYAHESTVHCDLKPENIAIVGSFDIKLMDFGLAQIMRPINSTIQRESVNQISAGTPYYMAPEQLALKGKVDAKADQYSLAVIAYEMLTGDLPLGVSASLVEKRPDLPLNFTSSIDRALNHSPSKRFASISDFASALNYGARPEGVIGTIRRRWKTANKLIKSCAIISFCTLLFIPLSIGLKNYIKIRNERVGIWNDRTMSAQSSLNQIREKTRSLITEKGILDRKLEIESAVNSDKELYSIDWLQTSNQWNAASLVCDWIEPRLNPDGYWSVLEDLLESGREAIADGAYPKAEIILNRFENESEKAQFKISNIRAIVSLKESIERHLKARENLTQTQGYPALKIERPDLDFLVSDDWTEHIKSMREDAALLKADMDEIFQARVEAYKKSKLHWEQIFPDELGPPDLSFLIDVDGMRKRASETFENERFDEALDLLNRATNTYDRWALEVIECRKSSQSSWDKAEKRIEAMGMRFVKIDNIYWSIWETRIMDFARWVSENPEVSHLILSQLELPPERVGPTHPLTGLDRRTVSGLATWFGYQMDFLGRPLGTLPTQKDWESLWISEDLKGKYKFGIIPVEVQDRLLVYRDYYLDNKIEPFKYLQPVGSKAPSPHGLFDLEGNAWEWSASDLILNRAESNNGEPLKWMVHGGGYFGQHRFNQYEPPRKNAVFITRPEAIGFRIVLSPTPSLEKLAEVQNN